MSLAETVWDRWLWWRRTAWFRFAHTPLCARFHKESLRLGGWRVCRSCSLLYGGMLLTGAALFFVTMPPAVLLASFYSLFVTVVLVSWPPLYRHLGRATRDAVRFSTGGVLAASVAVMLVQPWWASVLLALVMLTIFRAFRRARIRMKQHDCDGCSELGCKDVCSGYAAQAVSVRAYQYEMEERLNREGAVPLVLLKAERDH